MAKSLVGYIRAAEAQKAELDKARQIFKPFVGDAVSVQRQSR